jgi:hypothetical protein
MTTPTPHAPTLAIPLACVPGAIPAGGRDAHFELLTRLFTTAARERRGLPDGYAYRFDADALGDLARWIANERRCCPFLTFTVELSPNDGPLWLRLTGPDGTQSFLDAELPWRPASPTG